jgi:4a-hydroxytetrahydrobiopterin dehydratase
MKNPIPLTQQEIEELLSELPEWRFEDDRLKAAFNFTSFAEAMMVINKIAAICEEMDHHPLMTNVYSRLMFSLCTHRAGDRVTELDIELAKRILELIKSK